MSEEGGTHDDHREARHTHAEWLRDISHWRVDHHKAFAMMARVESMIQEMAAEMEAHAAAIRDHQFEISRHERHMSHRNATGQDDLDEQYQQYHDELEVLHADVEKHHAKLAARHNEMMNDLAGLFEALSFDELDRD